MIWGFPKMVKGLLARQKSSIHGYGLFTSGYLPAGTIICRRLGLMSDLSLRDKRAIIGIDGLDPAEPADIIFKNINHSCQPNACLTDTGCLINTRPIAGGTEITIDYSLVLTDSNWRVVCHCGQPHCRGMIQSPVNQN